jgi:DNA-binding NarL/FixJ family response regulator
MKKRRRLVLADDHHLVVEGLRRLLQPRFDVVAVAYSGKELLGLLPRVRADCLLLDLSLPGVNGLDLMPDIRATQPGLKVVIVTMHVDRVLADALMHAGADGFVPKDSGIAELEHAIDEVLKGRRYVSPSVPKYSNRAGLGAEHAGYALLTPRQLEVIRLVGQGKTTPEIAVILGVSQRAITFHRADIRRKLGIDSEWGLLRWAILTSAAAPPEGGAA